MNRKIHWVAWNKLVLPKNKGGLGVGCLRVINIALMAKWVWRLKNESTCLWSKCVKAWHNIKEVDGRRLAKASLKGLWWGIANINKDLKDWNIDLDTCWERKMGDGKNTHFWKDRWLTGDALKDVFPELYCNIQKC